MKTMKKISTWMKARARFCVCLCLAPLAMVASATVTVTTNGTAVTVKSTAIETLKEPFFGPAVETVTFEPKSVLTYSPKSASTYDGGTTVKGDVGNGYLLKVSRGDAFGYGPITLVDGAGLYVDEASSGVVTLTNKLNVTASSYVSSWSSSYVLTLCRLGFTSGSYGLRIGRVNQETVTRTTLSLDAATSDPIRDITLFGPVALTLDGGTVALRDTSGGPFINVYNKSTTAEPSLSLTGNGCTFDVPAGVSASLGLPIDSIKAPAPTITVLETKNLANNSFESALGSEWTLSGEGTHYGCGQRSNGSAFDSPTDQSYWTPAGSKYLMLRCKSSATQHVTGLEKGWWRVRFLCGCRAATDGPYSPQTIRVTLGDESQTFEFAAGVRFGFKELVTDPVELEGGEADVVLSTLGTYNVGSMNYDLVVLERVSLTYQKAPVVKSGLGELTIDGTALANAKTTVSAGTLELTGCELAGAAAEVAAGGCLSLAGCASAADWRVDVKAGGQLSLRDVAGNLVRNASFENEYVANWRAINPLSAQTPNWTMTLVETTPGNAGGCGGLQRNGGSISPSPNGPMTTFGAQTIALRDASRVTQTVTVPEDGTYRLSFVYATRLGNGNSYLIPLSAKVDGQVVVNCPAATDFFDFTEKSGTVELTAGTHDLVFETSKVDAFKSSGTMLLVDNVQLRRETPVADIEEGAFYFTSDSTLNLDYTGKLQINNLYVDGNKIDGGKAAIQRAGVTVTGNGDIHAGKTKGLCVIFW